MARGKGMGAALALIAILAILSGNISTVMGRWEISSPQSIDKDPLRGSTDSSNAVSISPEIGLWNIRIDVPNPVDIVCHNPLTLLPPQTVQPRSSWSHEFSVVGGSNDQWNCDFYWGKQKATNVEIWSLDRNSFTSTDSHWKVEAGGFYLRQRDGTFVRAAFWDCTPGLFC